MALRLVEQLDDRVRSVNQNVGQAPQAVSKPIIEQAEEAPEEAISEDLGYDLGDILQVVVKHGASDLHLKAGTPPTVRLHGDLVPVGNQILSPEDARGLIMSAMTKNQRALLNAGKEVDFAYACDGARFRVNAFLERGNVSAAFRMLRTDIPPIDSLGLPPVVKKLASLHNGLILVTGPAGSGKSTTLAAVIDYINTTRKAHVVTVEDPIEFFHKDKMSLITQREVGADTSTFAEALRMSLRQDPNVIMVGEMRDPETIMMAVTAAETGHLVLSTLHTPNATQAVDRILDTFTGDMQRQFRLLLANSLRGVMSQKLVTRAEGKGRALAAEVMIVTPTISSLILEGKTEDIYPYIKEGSNDGMQTFTQSLLQLYNDGVITKEEGLFYADQPTEFRMGVEGATTSTSGDMVDETLMNWL
ncbi:MAG: type IV pilus twitching motility protein PilT [bacterium]|nr:type IV pilus twitching motility protein PilT [bacterium]